jgi:hypothetical protein
MRKAISVAAAFLLAVVIALATGTAPASAWTGSSTVTVTGQLVQCSSAGPQNARVRATLDHQHYDYYTPMSMPISYSVTFTNVPPGNGGWAWFVIDCSADGGSLGHWVNVYRPWWGSTIYVDL